jgi:hypothetical protein
MARIEHAELATRQHQPVMVRRIGRQAPAFAEIDQSIRPLPASIARRRTLSPRDW